MVGGGRGRKGQKRAIGGRVHRGTFPQALPQYSCPKVNYPFIARIKTTIYVSFYTTKLAYLNKNYRIKCQTRMVITPARHRQEITIATMHSMQSPFNFI
jgi:hypothetical protein